jgi:hypothetical protein
MRFVREMRQLRSGTGLGAAELAARVHYPQDVIVAAEAGPSLPDLPVLSAYVHGCGGRVAEWEERWRSLTGSPAAPLGLPARPVGGSSLAAAGARAASSAPAVRIPDQRRIMAAISRAATTPPIPAQARAALPAAPAPQPPAPPATAPQLPATVAPPATRAEVVPVPATRAEAIQLPATRAEATMPPASPALGTPVVPSAAGAGSLAVVPARRPAPPSAAPVASVPAAISISRGAHARPAVTQPSKTLSVRWAPASLARRQPSIVHVVIAATVAAVMFIAGAIIMLLLRKG